MYLCFRVHPLNASGQCVMRHVATTCTPLIGLTTSAVLLARAKNVIYRSPPLPLHMLYMIVFCRWWLPAAHPVPCGQPECLQQLQQW